MSAPGQPAGHPSMGEALAAVQAGLGFIAQADAASRPADVLADSLKALERAESVHTAARARVLAAFSAQAGYAADGHRSARSWLAWQTRITSGAAAGAMGWGAAAGGPSPGRRRVSRRRGLAVEERHAAAGQFSPVVRTPLASGSRGRPPGSRLAHAERGNPVRVRGAARRRR